jgi:Fe-S cluster assembly protein SufD
VTLEEGSKVHLVEVGAFSSAFFVIKKNATLHHFLTGSSSSSCQVSVEESGAYHAVSVEDKHASSRNLQVLLEGSRAAMTLSHLSCGFDHEIKMNIDHQMPFTSSSILVKGVVDDGRRSYCESIVEMQKQAAHSESQQHFKYVTLGESAQARCSPKFAFHTDDIHASHGVTIQQFDQEMLFYLQARGLEKNEAKKQYLDGFCDEVLKNVCPFGIV